MTRVLVTGATGFIGLRLVKVLREAGMKVLALSRGGLGAWADTGVASIAADLTEIRSVSNVCTDVDGVFHLAGYAHAGDANDGHAAGVHRQLTVEGTRALLREACRAGVKRFVFVSSVKAMGEGSEECVDETVSASPATEYGRAKLEAEQLVLSCGRSHGMHVCILRLPLVYGPGVKGNLFNMIRAIDCGRFPPLPKVANKRSMVHVDDVVNALRMSFENSKANGEVFLLTDGRVYSTYDIYSSIRRALGKKPVTWAMPLVVLRAVAHIGDTVGHMRSRPFFFDGATLNKLLGSACYSSKKIQQSLGFEPSQTLEAALPEIINLYRSGAARLN